MPTVCTTVKVSKDGQYILATGKHLFGYNLHTFHNRKYCGGIGHFLNYPSTYIIKNLNRNIFKYYIVNVHLLTYHFDLPRVCCI